MMAVIILLGVGITVCYFYKRSVERSLKDAMQGKTVKITGISSFCSVLVMLELEHRDRACSRSVEWRASAAVPPPCPVPLPCSLLGHPYVMRPIQIPCLSQQKMGRNMQLIYLKHPCLIFLKEASVEEDTGGGEGLEQNSKSTAVM